MNVYIGTRTANGTANGKPTVVTANGKPLPPRNDLFNHSPTGFEWGYGGSGPAQLALAILAHHLGSVIDKRHKKSVEAVDRAAVRLHQNFKWAFVARWDRDGWELAGDAIDDWLTSTIVEFGEDAPA